MSEPIWMAKGHKICFGEVSLIDVENNAKMDGALSCMWCEWDVSFFSWV